VFPPETNWFAELTAATNAVINRGGVAYLSSSPTDSWGHSIIYVSPGKSKPDQVDVYSLGEDGKSVSGGNDRDDINNWNPDYPWRKYYSRWRLRWEFPSELWIVVAVLALGGLLYWIFDRPGRARPLSATPVQGPAD
jgi:hypothetical protein